MSTVNSDCLKHTLLCGKNNYLHLPELMRNINDQNKNVMKINLPTEQLGKLDIDIRTTAQAPIHVNLRALRCGDIIRAPG